MAHIFVPASQANSSVTDFMVEAMDDTAGLHFDGATYDHSRDSARLGEQMLAVLSVMSDGQWRTLADLASQAHAPEASVSARLRDLRKPRFGGYTVKRQYVKDGVHRYQLVAGETEH